MTNRHDPWPAHVVTDDSRVAAGSHDSVLNPARLQNVDSAIDCVAFANTAKVDAHPFVFESDSVIHRVEQEVVIVHRRQRGLDLGLCRVDVIGKVVQVPDTCVRDVERALGDLGEMDR